MLNVASLSDVNIPCVKCVLSVNYLAQDWCTIKDLLKVKAVLKGIYHNLYLFYTIVCLRASGFYPL